MEEGFSVPCTYERAYKAVDIATDSVDIRILREQLGERDTCLLADYSKACVSVLDPVGVALSWDTKRRAYDGKVFAINVQAVRYQKISCRHIICHRHRIAIIAVDERV